MLTSCKTIYVTEYVYPDAAWVQPTPLDLGEPQTYGDILNDTLPRCVQAYKKCELDKGAVRDWMSRERPAP
jgi:hypothetical protein